jgi:hypothetical protein
MKGFYVIVLTALIMGWLAAQSRTSSARKIADRWLFPPVRALKIIFCLAIAMGITFVTWGFYGNQNDRTTGIVIGSLIVTFCALAWPKVVYVSASGVQQRSWWGGWRSIAWREVSETKELSDGSVAVRSDKDKITFTPYHAGRELFLELINKSGLQVHAPDKNGQSR